MAATARDKLQAIDQVLLGFIGKTGSEAVYSYLERNYGLRKEELPKRIETFALGIEAAFGSSALIIEKLVIRNLQSRLTYQGEKPYGFLEFMKKIQEPV